MKLINLYSFLLTSVAFSTVVGRPISISLESRDDAKGTISIESSTVSFTFGDFSSNAPNRIGGLGETIQILQGCEVQCDEPAGVGL